MTLPYATLPGDIDHMIENDFAVVERQFQHLEAGRGNRRALVDQIGFELALHAFAVEQVLYPAFEQAGQTRDLEQARERNNTAKQLLVTLQRTDPGEPEFEDALTQLIAGVREQHAGSDAESLPVLRDNVGAERLAALGKEFLAAKRVAPTAPHPHAPDQGVAEKVAGALSKPLDQLKAKATGMRKELATDPSGLLHPQAQAIADAHSSLEPLPFEILEPDQARRQPGPKEAVQKVMAELGLEGPEPVGSVQDLEVPDGAGGTQRLRVYTPEGVAAGAPIVFWVHGGGWVLFTIDDHYDDSCRGLCNKTGAIVVTPDYRRAPEAVFPASHDDVLAAYRWTVQNAASLGGDPARIVIGGESVGGGMSVATVLQLAEAGEQTPLAQVLVYPVTTAEQFGESMADAADAPPAQPAAAQLDGHARLRGQARRGHRPADRPARLEPGAAPAHAADPGHHRRARRPAQPGPAVRQGPAGRRCRHQRGVLPRRDARVLRRLRRLRARRAGAAGRRRALPRSVRAHDLVLRGRRRDQQRRGLPAR